MDWGIVIIISMLVIAYMYANKKEKKESTVFELKQDVFRKQLIHELNVEVFKQDDRCYIVGYQGGTFVITFDEKNHSVLLGYPFLNEIKHEDIPHVLIVENEINSNEIWSCSHSENLDCRSEYPLQVELNYFFIPQGTVKQSCEAIRRLFITAFEIGRKYNDLLKAQLDKRHSSIENENINGDYKDFIMSLENAYGNDVIVLGRGDKGALMYVKAEERFYEFPAVSVGNVVNTVGAGDALCSSFVHFYAKGLKADEALMRAQIFASYKIGFDGASEGFATEEKVEELMGV